MSRLGVYFALKSLRPFYDLTTDEEANNCVCVLAKANVGADLIQVITLAC